MRIHLKRKNQAFNFEAENESGLRLNTDGSPQIGGENLGFRPMELVLTGVASCSTIDLLLILKKQRQEVTDIEIIADAVRTEDDAKRFEKISLTYIVSGKVEETKLQKAIDLALTKYCSAVLSLNPDIEIKSEYKIQE